MSKRKEKRERRKAFSLLYTMYNILFRVDGSSNIGMGHVMRSLTIAKEFRKMNCNVVFISKYKEGVEKILEEDFNVIKLRNGIHLKGYDYGEESELKAELEELQKIFNNYSYIDLFLVDSYNVTDNYFLEIKKYVNRLAYIDDINKFCKHIDILINGNITANDMGYKKYREDQLLFLGTKYNLIRDEFKNLPKRSVNDDVRKVMITTGGADPYNMSIKLLDILLKSEKSRNLQYYVVLGKGFKNKEKLKDFSKKYANVVLKENVKYMSKIMLECDVAISAGGGTLYELCSCGTPTIAFIVAENQEKLVDKLSRLKYIKSIGWYDEITKNKLISVFNKLCRDKDARKDMSSRGQFLVDGLGGSRITKEIINSLT